MAKRKHETDHEDSAEPKQGAAKAPRKRSNRSTEQSQSTTGTSFHMETYNGLVRTPTDAIILFEACRLGLLPRVQRRLSEKERQSIRSGSVFVWDEREAGMRRWTDGKSWSASRVSGSFLTYREMEGKRGSTNPISTPANRSNKTPDSQGQDEMEDGAEGPDGYRYKPDGLMKQSFSITTSQGQALHLISYYSRSSPTAQVLRQPSQDPNLASIQPAKGMYPDSTVNDHASVPAVTRSPMPGAPNYVVAPQQAYARPPHPQAYLPPGYIPYPPYGAYPLSPMATPPPYAIPYPQPGMHPLAFHPGYAQHPHMAMQAPPSAYDQRPQRSGDLQRSHSQQGMPPAPYTQSLPPPPVTQSYPQSSYATTAPGLHQSKSDSSASVIDPRLSAPPSTDPQLQQHPNQYQHPSYYQQPVQQLDQPQQAPPEAQSAQQQPSHDNQNVAVVTASQAPSINALVSGLSQDAASAINTQATTANGANSAQGEAQSPTRDGSTSPGGTKHVVRPQDIPSEKLGFKEDKRALSMLDRTFARV